MSTEESTEEINCFLQLVPRSCFPASDTGVTAITAEPNLPGLPCNPDLSFLMKCSNTRPLKSSTSYISTFCHAPLRVKEHRVILWRWKATISTFFWPLMQQHCPPPSPRLQQSCLCWLPHVWCLQKTGLTGRIKHFNFTGNVAKIIAMTRFFFVVSIVCVHVEHCAQLLHAQIKAEQHDPHLSAANRHNEGVCTRIGWDITNQCQIYILYTNNSTNIMGMYDIIFLITRRDVTLAFNTGFVSFWHSD